MGTAEMAERQGEYYASMPTVREWRHNSKRIHDRIFIPDPFTSAVSFLFRFDRYILATGRFHCGLWSLDYAPSLSFVKRAIGCTCTG